MIQCKREHFAGPSLLPRKKVSMNPEARKQIATDEDFLVEMTTLVKNQQCLQQC